MRTKLHRAFTLIELLAVIAIMGLIFAVGIPAFYKFSQSAGLSAGASQLVGTLSLARQYAITHREHTYVVFPYKNTSQFSNMNKWYLSYTVISSNRTTGLDYVNKWEYLPRGAIFLNLIPGGPGGKGFDLDNLVYIGHRTFSLPNGSFDLAYFEFTPTGAAPYRGVGTTNVVTIAEGYTDNDKPYRTSSNYVNVVIESLTGRIRTERPQ